MRHGRQAIILLTILVALAACNKPLKTEDAGLLAAARTGHSGTIRDLLASGANVNVRDEHSNTPLMEAARNGHDDCVRTLLDAGANWRLKNEDGKTALMLARQNSHEDATRALQQAGATE